LKKIIKPGEVVPPFYGIAYQEYYLNIAVCYPLGVNLIVLLYRDWVFWWKNPKQNN